MTLYIDNDLVTLAKSSNMNLSAEFEEWIKIRLGKMGDETKKVCDPENEILRMRAEIQKLESQKELYLKEQNKEKEINMVLDGYIDNMIEFKEDLTNPSDSRTHGVQFLMQKKFHQIIGPLEAKELLLNRIKERGL